jgi:hypothetical protein
VRARAAECRVEFIRTKAPERAYDELAALHWNGSLSSAEAAQEDLRASACQLGADAVIVTRDYVPYTQNATAFMTGTAIKYRVVTAEKMPSAASSKP